MAWNESGDNEQGPKDPWGRRNSGQQPPDLDALWKKLKEQWEQLWGPKKPGSSGPTRISSSTLLGLLLVGFLVAGYYSVEEGSRAVVLRFGRYLHTVGSGPHWRIPFVDDKIVVDAEQVRTYKREGMMLTRDENIIGIELDIQYKIGDVDAYVFTARDPDFLIQQVSESALRQVIGRTDLDTIITMGRGDVAAETKTHLQSLLDHYKVGLLVTQVNLQKAGPPEQVKAAFDDVIRAREDRSRFINEAEAYAIQLLPLAQGEAKRIGSEAQGYRESVIAEATGKSERFQKLLFEYEKSPEVTRERLYLETLEAILGKTPKILVDGQHNGPLFYIPLEKPKRGGNSEPTPAMEKAEAQNHDIASTPPDIGPREQGRQRERGPL